MRKLLFILVIIITNIFYAQDLNHWDFENSLKNKDTIKKKIAFLIANSNYQNNSLDLKNPLNDVKKISEPLEKLGFDILFKKQVTLKEIQKIIVEFKDSIVNYDFGLFYYAGHGFDDNNGNPYILPVNIKELTSNDNNYEPISRMVNYFGSSRKKCLIIIDACRNNGNNGINKPNNIKHPRDVKLWYSTSSGKTANDEEFIIDNKKYGCTLYAYALYYYLTKASESDLTIQNIFNNIYTAVSKITENTDREQWPSEFFGQELNNILLK
tara:strand:+ start:780 stop:1583 length:804 start_codon:yes stop_codon:yes gene_type:complete